MLTYTEAEKIALEHLNKDKTQWQEILTITNATETPYGWIFSYNLEIAIKAIPIQDKASELLKLYNYDEAKVRASFTPEELYLLDNGVGLVGARHFMVDKHSGEIVYLQPYTSVDIFIDEYATKTTGKHSIWEIYIAEDLTGQLSKITDLKNTFHITPVEAFKIIKSTGKPLLTGSLRDVSSLRDSLENINIKVVIKQIQ